MNLTDRQLGLLKELVDANVEIGFDLIEAKKTDQLAVSVFLKFLEIKEKLDEKTKASRS